MSIPLWVTNLPWPEINVAAKLQQVDPLLLAAIVQQESGGKQFAVRYEPEWAYLYKTDEYAKSVHITQATEIQLQKMSFGLCQVMGSVLRELGFGGHLGQAYDVKTNLMYGAKKLAQLMAHYRSMDLAIVSYNAGSPRKTPTGQYTNQAYLDSVLRYYKELTS